MLRDATMPKTAMPTRTTKTRRRTAYDLTPYLKLVKHFPLRTILSESELDQAIAVINSLIDRDLLPAEEDYLDVLSDLVERYEDKHHPIPDVPGHEMLAYLIEQKQVTQSDVASATGIAVSTLSEILKGKRTMNRAHIQKLSQYFHLEPSVFFDG